MNTYNFKKSLAGIAFGIGALVAPVAAPAAALPMVQDECARELLLSYFPEPIVKEALKKFNVPEDKWAAITKSLSAKDKEVVKIVEQKASAMNPNPLKDPQQRQAAVKLFRETLLQIFSDAMKEGGVTDSSQFQAMLDDIQQQKAKKFAMCMEKQKAQLEKSQQTHKPSTDDEEGDDEDYSDEDDSEEEDDEDSSSKK